jgi:hypothetical protein
MFGFDFRFPPTRDPYYRGLTSIGKSFGNVLIVPTGTGSVPELLRFLPTVLGQFMRA